MCVLAYASLPLTGTFWERLTQEAEAAHARTYFWISKSTCVWFKRLSHLLLGKFESPSAWCGNTMKQRQITAHRGRHFPLNELNNWSWCWSVLCCQASGWAELSPRLFTLNVYVTWRECQPSAAIALLLSDFVSHFGSHYCWFMSLSTEQFAPADKIKFHTLVQCQRPLLWVFVLMMILIAGDDANWPDGNT